MKAKTYRYTELMSPEHLNWNRQTKFYLQPHHITVIMDATGHPNGNLHEVYDEMRVWLEHEGISFYEQYYGYTSNRMWVFNNEEDAVRFYLTWMS